MTLKARIRTENRMQNIANRSEVALQRSKIVIDRTSQSDVASHLPTRLRLHPKRSRASIFELCCRCNGGAAVPPRTSAAESFRPLDCSATRCMGQIFLRFDDAGGGPEAIRSNCKLPTTTLDRCASAETGALVPQTVLQF
jgi:hypothetical protein